MGSMHRKTPKTFLRVQRPGPWPLLFRLPPLPVWMAPDPPPASGGPLRPGRRSWGCSGPAAPGLPSPLTRRPAPLPSSWPRSRGSLATATPEPPPPPSAPCRPPRAARSAHSPGDPGPAPGFLSRCPRASFLLFEVPHPRPPSGREPESPRAWPACQGPGHAPSCAACCPQDTVPALPLFPELPSAAFGPHNSPEASGRPGQGLYTIPPPRAVGRLGAGVQRRGPISSGAGDRGHMVSLLRGEGPRPVARRCSGISLPGREAGNALNPRPAQGPLGSGALGETPGGASTCAPSRDTCPPAEVPGGEPPHGHLGGRGPGRGRPVHPPGAPALPPLGLTLVPHAEQFFLG